MQAQLLRTRQTILGVLNKVSVTRLNHVIVHLYPFLLLHALLFLSRLRLDIHLLHAASLDPEDVRCQDGMVPNIVVIWRDHLVGQD